jgi:hypothetical protein
LLLTGVITFPFHAVPGHAALLAKQVLRAGSPEAVAATELQLLLAAAAVKERLLSACRVLLLLAVESSSFCLPSAADTPEQGAR